jgi:sugar lactone lactonase YvrE
LAITGATIGMNGYQYHCVATNSAGSATSNAATLTVNSGVVMVTPLTVSTLAGRALTSGYLDGTGTAALFYYPSGVAADTAGNLYLSDTDNHTIRKVVTATGAVTTLAGLAGSPGSVDGAGSAARFNNPSGIAVDGTGNVYVADTLNHILRKVTSAGLVTTLAGATGSGGSADGAGGAARFQGPQGLAIDSAGNLYVADTNNHTVRKVVAATGAVTTVAGLAGNTGSADGSGSAARFNFPSEVAIDSTGNIYVADTDNDAIRAISSSGLVSTLAGRAGSPGSVDGTGSAARFDSPSAVAVDPAGNVYVADTGNFTIRRVIPSSGAVSTLAGVAGTSGSADGIGSAVRFYAPAGLAVDGASTLYVADTNNHTVRISLLPITPAIQTQPLSQSVTAGNGVQFSVTASGRPTPTYQWNFGGSPINGATSSSYSITSAQSGNAGDYTVTVTNAMGSVTSSRATLTVASVTPAPTEARGGGGGGAMSLWFLLALAILCFTRRSFRCAIAAGRLPGGGSIRSDR